MKPLYDTPAMRQLDQRTIEAFGIPALVLMEHAGMEVLKCLEARYPDPDRRFAVVCGPGNNGGDGLVIARLLFQKGRDVVVAAPARKAIASREALSNLDILERLGVPVFHFNDKRKPAPGWFGERLLVDCLFGTGLKRPLEGVYADLVETMNAGRQPVFSVDMPSGIDGDTGKSLGPCVSAEATITLGARKLGQFQGEGFLRRGDLTVGDIGIPARAHEGLAPRAWLYEPGDVSALLEPKGKGAHKYGFGKVLFFSGSRNMPGAAFFNALGAARAGAGLVRMAVEASVWPIVAGRVPEAVACVHEAEDTGRAMLPAGLSEAMEAAMVLGAGSGSGRTPLLKKVLETMLGLKGKTLVLDADALGVLADTPGLLEGRKADGPVVVTPHQGEMMRFDGFGDAVEDMVACARRFSQKYGVYTVLKGPMIAVAEPGGEAVVCAGGHPALATAGSGDVLTGVVAGVLAQVKNPAIGVPEAITLYQTAGGLAAGRLHERSVSATDVGESIPAALKHLKNIYGGN